MEHMEPRLQAFWVIHLIALGIFGLEFLFVLSIWLRGRVPGLSTEASWAAKLWAVITRTVKVIFSRRLWVVLKALVADGMIHVPLMKKDAYRWIGHIATTAWRLSPRHCATRCKCGTTSALPSATSDLSRFWRD